MKRLTIIVILVVMGTDILRAQDVFFHKVQPPKGKVFEHVTGMVQDRGGYMWLATKKGLLRYDGYEMKIHKHNPADPQSLARDALEAIAIDSSGILWLATYGGGGLERFDPVTGRFTHYRHNPADPNTLSHDWVTALWVDRDGVLWVGTSGGLDRFDARTNTFKHFAHNPADSTSLSSNAVASIYEDRQGVLWIGTGSVYSGPREEGGLNRLDKRTGTFTRYLHDPKNPHTLLNNKVRAILEDSRGTFWVGTAGDGLHTMDRARGTFQRHMHDPAHPGSLSRPPLHRHLAATDHITFIKEDASKAIWIGTSESGIARYLPGSGKLQYYSMEKDTAGAFTDRAAWAAYTSRDGVLWISTMHGTLYRLNPRPRPLPFYAHPGGGVNVFFQGADGILWTATEKGLVLQDPRSRSVKKWYAHDPANPSSLSHNYITSLKEDQQGRMWVGTIRGLNLMDRKKGTFTRYHHHPNKKNSLSHDVVTTMLEDSKANLWVGTLRGLNRMNLQTGIFTRYHFFPQDTTGLDGIVALWEDREGFIWAGCYSRGGVYRLDPATGRFRAFLKGVSTFSLYEDRKGIMWVGGSDGLFHYDRKAGSFVRFSDSTSNNELNTTLSIVEDDDGNLWASSPQALFRINPERTQATWYGVNYGITNSTFFWSSFKDRDGKLYFGTNRGYYTFFPRESTRGLKPPEILFAGFRLSDRMIQPAPDGPLRESLATAREIRLHHNQNIFSFDFAAIDYTDPENNRHFFMLEGYDQGWNQAGSDRKAVYFNVPPGRYTFRVKAANGYDVWAEKSIGLIITPPWWSTWWFRIPVAILVIAALYGVIRWRMQQKFRRRLEHSEKEKQLADLRHKTAELEMQALRAQMNPHFLFNSLNSINRFILQNNKAGASEYLTKFSRLVRLILQNSQADLIPLESELQALRLYLELEALRFEGRFDYRIEVDEDIDEGSLKVPPLIIQPFAENAIWHGLMHKEEKGHLAIAVYLRGDLLCYRISDDGIGRQRAAELKSRAGNTHKSMGMRITADRIALLQQQKLIDTSIEVTDRVLSDGSPGGTEVVLKLPTVYD